VVDENDVQIGTASRGEVHARDLRHRAIHIFVFNRAGEIFMQLRSRWKDRHPSKWDSSAAGHVNAGDDYEETARRELEEELGVTAPVEEIGRVAACEQTGWEFVRLYRAQHEGPFRLPPAEIESGAWFTPEQIERWAGARPGDFAPGFLECWKRWSARE
jgi:16S rRNA (adenine1518-N6/adenine1519-N6)-dimethyltransferase